MSLAFFASLINNTIRHSDFNSKSFDLERGSYCLAIFYEQMTENISNQSHFHISFLIE